MNVCLIGDGLISLSLAKALINNNFKVFMFVRHNSKTPNDVRTIGISSSNIDFFQKEILRIKKNLIWDIFGIEIYNNQNKEEKILDFKDSNKILFSIIRNKDLYNLLNQNLKKNSNFKKIIIKNKSFYKKNKFDLIINCDGNNEIFRKYFSRKILKDYNSTAYASIINHSKTKNRNAFQVFTNIGPVAFLPTSETKTSVVCSVKNKYRLSQSDFNKIIYKNNKKYNIKSIKNFETFPLKSKILKNYYKNNILAFGDILHQIHPLSGQGFNMTIRDIKVLLRLFSERKNLGLAIDYSVFKEFEKETKHLNFIFSSGNDFIYEFFNYDNFYLKFFSNKIFKYLKENKFFNNQAIKFANKGLVF